MKHIFKHTVSVALVSLILSACATNSNSQAPAPDARASLGKITEKQTIRQYSERRTSPVDVSVGVGGGGGHVGWGVNFGLAQILNIGQLSSPEILYRYTVQTQPKESLIIQTSDEFNLNDCVTVWQRPNDASYPRLRINSSCTLAQ